MGRRVRIGEIKGTRISLYGKGKVKQCAFMITGEPDPSSHDMVAQKKQYQSVNAYQKEVRQIIKEFRQYNEAKNETLNIKETVDESVPYIATARAAAKSTADVTGPESADDTGLTKDNDQRDQGRGQHRGNRGDRGGRGNRGNRGDRRGRGKEASVAEPSSLATPRDTVRAAMEWIKDEK